MLALPARIAGCGEVILCTPAGRGGKIAPEVLFAADLCGVDRIFAVGGAQAVAAMAYGTESIPHVEKIFGPGNRYVTRAKQLVSTEAVAVDLPAGPSEVMVLADNSAGRNSSPPICCRRPSTGTTARPSWSAGRSVSHGR